MSTYLKNKTSGILGVMFSKLDKYYGFYSIDLPIYYILI